MGPLFYCPAPLSCLAVSALGAGFEHLDIATSDAEETASDSKSVAKRKGRARGLNRGNARAQHLTPEQREDMAKLAPRAHRKKTD